MNKLAPPYLGLVSRHLPSCEQSEGLITADLVAHHNGLALEGVFKFPVFLGTRILEKPNISFCFFTTAAIKRCEECMATLKLNKHLCKTLSSEFPTQSG